MLEIRGIRKHYGNTRALDGLDLSATPGEILGIAGPNGAGKTTLIRILAGEEIETAGSILLDGKPWSPGTTDSTVAVVHQESQLFPNLSVRDNLAVGRESSRFWRPRSGPNEGRVLTWLGLAGYANSVVGSLPLAVQQRTEIARALVRDARLFLFDEPNSALTEDESRDLFAWMRSLAGAGRIVMFVSHRLSELVAHSNRVNVIRDGRCVETLEGDALTHEAVARALVVEHERRESLPRPAERMDGSPVLLHARNWKSKSGAFAVADFNVRRGEIVAVTGVEGSGAREFVASLGGHERARGSAEIAGFADRRAIRAMTAYLPANRRESLFPNFSVAENLVSRLGNRRIATRFGVLRGRRITAVAERARKNFHIRCSSIRQLVAALSGGNQQKVALAAVLNLERKLIIAEEPTQGVDLSSKAEIHHLLRSFADEGNGVLLYGVEIPEVFEMADRVHVMHKGAMSPAIDVARFLSAPELAAEVVATERGMEEAMQGSTSVVEAS